ncbi:TRAP transporter fused permease subunit [Pseudooceanicola sp. 216_PA32_1]|uniref:TRAP transporter fused permease subunit n=1 Tax=Pseudooceanicola pacificus TaxID=2676438 RepID=A0A844VY61_9RHOB|nr:TRAP transporter fused permease subunit [Pseudooceanicola pacificus]MWB76646.1 TRAP transporter fused permease subunit [Pseudooceanicola pacificus]
MSLTLSRKIALALGLLLSLQAIYTAYFGMFEPGLHRTLAFGACILTAVLFRPLAARLSNPTPLKTALAWLVDVVLLVIIFAALQRFIATADAMENMLISYSALDQWLALLALFACVELTRREFGMGLTVVAGGVLAYCLWGQHLPGLFRHAGFTLDQIVQGTWYGYAGVFGMPVSVVIELLFIYIVFGMVLEATGAGRALIRIAVRVTGRVSGGPAHAAIVASTLFGSMSGSVTANVAGTGTFTIPMMKQKGFRPEFAGAVEAAASTAGQFIPPVMGAVAFMLAQLTSTPYLLVCVAAIVPAAAYVIALFTAVWLEARRSGIGSTAPEDMPVLTRRDAVDSLMFVIPILMVIGILLMGRSPAMAGFGATIAALVLGFLNPEIRKNPRLLAEALAKGGISGARIMIAVGAIGIVVAGMNLTGLGLNFAQSVGALGSHNLFLSLILTALACLALGMGMPTLPAYLIIVLVMGPALSAMGAPRIAVHMFVLYFAVLSAITPPVALAAFAAAPIADANPMKVGIVAMRLTIVGFIVPFLFVLNPSLLLIHNFDAGDFTIGILRIACIIWALSAALAGYGAARLSPVWRGAYLFAAALCLARGSDIDFIGFALVAGLLVAELLRARAQPRTA